MSSYSISLSLSLSSPRLLFHHTHTFRYVLLQKEEWQEITSLYKADHEICVQKASQGEKVVLITRPRKYYLIEDLHVSHTRTTAVATAVLNGSFSLSLSLFLSLSLSFCSTFFSFSLSLSAHCGECFARFASEQLAKKLDYRSAVIYVRKIHQQNESDGGAGDEKTFQDSQQTEVGWTKYFSPFQIIVPSVPLQASASKKPCIEETISSSSSSGLRRSTRFRKSCDVKEFTVSCDTKLRDLKAMVSHLCAAFLYDLFLLPALANCSSVRFLLSLPPFFVLYFCMGL